MGLLWNQLCGLEPEPVWMSEIGAFLVVVVFPAAMVLVAVACGVKP